MLPNPPAPPAAVAQEIPPQQIAGLLGPLVVPAQTHGFEVELVGLTNRLIERLVDKRPSISEVERRRLERTAKARVAEILKRTAVECARAINGVAQPALS